jgi:hypothetical protein
MLSASPWVRICAKRVFARVRLSAILRKIGHELVLNRAPADSD